MDIQYFKTKLEEELALIEGELKNIAEKNPKVKNGKTDWVSKLKNFFVDSADDSELGDRMEELEEQNAVVQNLEGRYNEIKSALAKIDAGTYGKCEICGKNIEEDRLGANPSAKTCKTHMN